MEELSPTHELTWELMFNRNGYYQAASKFEDFIDELEETDIDFSGEIEESSIQTELDPEQAYVLMGFNKLVMRYISMYCEEDVLDQGFSAGADSLEEYVSAR